MERKIIEMPVATTKGDDAHHLDILADMLEIEARMEGGERDHPLVKQALQMNWGEVSGSWEQFLELEANVAGYRRKWQPKNRQ